MALGPNPDKPEGWIKTLELKFGRLVIMKEDKVNIIVCLKQVPDTESQIKIGSDGKSIATDDIKMGHESI